MRVIGIGQCSWDYLAEVDSFPEADTKVELRSWQEQGGGPVATALVALSRLGIPCRFHGVVGDDTQGGLIRESLVAEGVDTSGLIVRQDASSQLAFIAIERGSGKRTIFWKKPSGDPLRADELCDSFLDGTGFLHLDGLMPDISLFAAREARKRAIPVMVDAGKMRPGMLELAQLSDYVVASEQFARDISPLWEHNLESFIDTLRNLGLGLVTITLGNRGSITFLNGEILRIPAFTVTTMDTTGAGDVFHGGYLYGIFKGWSLEDSIRFASALAALKCMKIGGRAGIPSLSETVEFLAEHGFHQEIWKN